MERDLARFIWPALIASLLAYSVYLFWGNVIAQTERAHFYNITITHTKDTRGHYFKGIIMVPSKCHDLAIESLATSVTHRHFRFRSAKAHNETCPNEPDPRAFSIFIDRFDADEIITGSLDGEPLNITLVHN